MNIENLRDYCLNKPYAEECFPFDLVTLVFKVKGKMFALTSLDTELRVNVKCNPELAIELREQYPYNVIEGIHMSKKHWNTIIINDNISRKQVEQWIDQSYELVWQSLPKKLRHE